MFVTKTVERSVEELLSFEESYAVFAPEGSMELARGVKLVTEAIEHCRTKDIRGLVVDVRNLIGLKNPSVGEKYWYTQDWAKASDGKVAVAIIANRDLIDPTKIGVMMAENVGLRSNVFDNSNDALAWLERHL